MRAFAFGGGVQSHAALVLAADGKIDYRLFLFSNVGEDSENPDTLDYIEKWSIPYALKHGLSLVEVKRHTNDDETLYQLTMRETKSIYIPVRMKNGAPGNRSCTQHFKRDVIRKWLGKGDHVVGLGISWDEVGRMRTDSGYKNIVNEYPLIDLRLSRKDCLKIIRDAGLPQPPKSSCWFCPFHNTAQWRDMAANEPERFARAVEFEQRLIEKRTAMGRDPVYLGGKGVTLDQMIGQPMSLGLEDDNCESGYCMV